MFGEIIAEMKSDNDLRKFVKKTLLKREEYPPVNKDSVIRASSILEFCPRREALRSIHNIFLARELKPDTFITFQFGRAFELMIRDQVLGPLKILIGKWQCKNCLHIPEEIDGFVRYPIPDECPKCRHNSFTYQEERIIDPISNIGGSPDGFIRYKSVFAILELKTINSFYARNLKQPLPQHIAQTQIYMHVTGYKKTYIWYFNKDSSADYGFWVDYDPEYAKLLLKKGHDLSLFFKERVMPEKICSNQETPRAQNCVTCEQCFSRVDPDIFERP